MKKTGSSDNLVVVAVLYLLIAIPAVFAGLVILAVPIPAILLSGAPVNELLLPLAALGFAFVVTGGMGTMILVTGFGLLAGREWARILALLFAVPLLLAFPFGTCVGVIAIVLLLQEASGHTSSPPSEPAGTEIHQGCQRTAIEASSAW